MPPFYNKKKNEKNVSYIQMIRDEDIFSMIEDDMRLFV